MKNKLQITPGFFLFAALCMLVLPWTWVMGAVTAALVHEAAHCLAVTLCGGQVLNFTLAAQGARIETGPLPPGKEMFCALAGPAGSFSMLALSEYLPEAAVCGFIQGAYNLIPIFPLDGGRALHCMLPLPVCRAAEAFILTLLTGISLLACTYQPELGIMILLMVWYPLIQRKFSCKDAKLAVQ